MSDKKKEKRRGHGEGSYYQTTVKGIEYYVKEISLPDGRRKKFYGKSKRELHAKETDFHRKQMATQKRSDQTVRQYLAAWLEITRNNCRPNTYISYEYLIRKHIAPAVGAVRLDALTPQHVQKMIDKSKASAIVINRARACLRNAMNYAIDNGIVDMAKNPASKVKVPREPEAIIKVLTEAEAKQFFAVLKNYRIGMLFVTAAITGMRSGELLSLQWKDLDLKNRKITVRCTLNRKNRKGEDPKTDESKRIITIPQRLASGLAEYKLSHDEHGTLKKSRGLWQENNLVFSSIVGTPLWDRNIKRILRDALKKAGLPDMRFHDLRHSAATLMLAMGIKLSVVRDILGHASIKTTDRYTHVLEGMRIAAADKMDDILL